MASVSDPQQEQQQNAQQPQGTPSSPAPTQAAGAANGARSTSAPSSASGATPGTPATNVGAYLAANAPQVQEFGNNISGQLGAQYGQTVNAINTAGTNFNNAVSSGYTPVNSAVTNAVTNNPTTAAQDPNNVSAFLGQLNDQYKGPSQFETTPDYSKAQNEVTTAQNAAQPWTSFSGTEAQFQGLGDTTPGQQALDATLVAQTPGVTKQIQDAAGQFGTLPDYLNSISSTANQGVTTAQNNVAQARTAAQQGLTTNENSLTNNINNATTQAQTTAEGNQATLSRYLNDLQKGGLTAGEQSQLGFNPLLTQAIPDVSSVVNEMQSGWANLPTLGQAPSLMNFTNVPASTPLPTAAQIATPDQYAEAAALQQFAGGPLSLPINPGDASQAGTYKMPSSMPTVDTSGYTSALNSYLSPWLSPAGITPVSPEQTGAAQSAESDYTTLMNTLASLMGKGPVNANYPTLTTPAAPTAPPTQPTMGGGVGTDTPPVSSTGGGKASR